MQAIQEAAHLLVNREDPDGSPFLGTCFCFRSSATMLTAAHLVVGRDLASLGVSRPVVGWSTGSLPIEALEVHPSADVAVLRIRKTGLSGCYAFHGFERILGLGEEVQAYGFPEDTHGDGVRPTPRMFVGNVRRKKCLNPHGCAPRVSLGKTVPTLRHRDCRPWFSALSATQLAAGRERDRSQLTNRNPSGASNFGWPGPGVICSCSSSILFFEQSQHARA
jgi:hypothetical protein